MNLENKKIYGAYRLDYLHFNQECVDAVVVLHGFAESAEIIYEKLKQVLPKTKQIIIPNGIFPLPKKVQDTNLREVIRNQLLIFLEAKNYEAAKTLLIPVASVDIAEAIADLPQIIFEV